VSWIDAERCYADDDKRSQLRHSVEVTLDFVRGVPEELWTEVYVAEFLQIREVPGVKAPDFGAGATSLHSGKSS
jgi:hypothetical protein